LSNSFVLKRGYDKSNMESINKHGAISSLAYLALLAMADIATNSLLGPLLSDGSSLQPGFWNMATLATIVSIASVMGLAIMQRGCIADVDVQQSSAVKLSWCGGR
jgi:ABC-type dipeptide/oligopeptide/nickel transport system permease subunit